MALPLTFRGSGDGLPAAYTVRRQALYPTALQDPTTLISRFQTLVPMRAIGVDPAVIELESGNYYCADRRSIAYQKKIERSRMKAPIQSSTIGTKGLTFKTSCDNSVAIAPAK